MSTSHSGLRQQERFQRSLARQPCLPGTLENESQGVHHLIFPKERQLLDRN